MAWVGFALLSAVLWGGVYMMYEQILKSISAPTLLFFGNLGGGLVFLGWLLTHGMFKKDIAVIKDNPHLAGLLAGIIGCGVLANLTFLVSMKQKNATLSGLIEITYPLFTALFVWFFYRESQMSTGTFFGAFLIFSGIVCISYFERTT